MDLSERQQLVASLCDLAESAGREILSVYGTDVAIRTKADATPVTEADERAERAILAGLARIVPDIPVVAEESVAEGRVPDIAGRAFLLVDPLDGTKEFISRNGEFTVNIALVENARPVLGVVHLPVLEETYWSDGESAWRLRDGKRELIACRRPRDGLVVVASRSHRDAKTDEFLSRYKVAKLVSAGSSLKFCRIAEGAADMYPRIGRTMEWDVAAGQAVLEAAGGRVTDLEGNVLRYGKPGFANPHFVATGLDDGAE